MGTVKTFDLTPTWATAAEIIIRVMMDGTEKGKKLAAEELRAMARVADAYVEEHKGDKE